ncbi:MAG: spore cortex biosynthesis protein YabQ [Oscillospiraceae bacterium]|nr:spore cortex biosynthesis protein YabQ [Oscillospiraceae bacterium]
MMHTIPDTYWTTQEELALFGGSVLLGIPAGMLLDLFRAARRLCPHHPAAVALEDILWLLGVSTMLLCYASAFAKGVFRGYYAVGCLCGTALYVCTLARLVLPVLTGLAGLLLLPVQAIARICRKALNRFVKISQKIKQGQEIEQNRLQRPRKKVYNKRSTKQKGNRYGRKEHKTKQDQSQPDNAARPGGAGTVCHLRGRIHRAAAKQHCRKKA